MPDDFAFALKVPESITHESYLEDCNPEWLRFLKLLDPLGDKRGPLLFHFPYVAKGKDAHDLREPGDRKLKRNGASSW